MKQVRKALLIAISPFLVLAFIILGLLWFVDGVTDVGMKYKLDRESLSKFSQSFAAIMDRPQGKELSTHDSFAGAMREAYNKELLGFDTMTRLAGSSGAAGYEDEYAQVHEDYTTVFCVFTGPGNLRKARNLMRATGDDRCVVFTYNHHFIDKYYEYENENEYFIVALLSGEDRARVYTLSELADEFPDTEFARQVEAGPLNLKSVYGMPPFQHVLPE